jgi:hypothetical protein
MQPGLDAIQPSAGGILGRLKDLANGFDPRNVVNAFTPMNMQASTDRILNAIAANPMKTAAARSYRAFTKGAEREMAPQLRAAKQQYAIADDPSQQ